MLQKQFIDLGILSALAFETPRANEAVFAKLLN